VTCSNPFFKCQNQNDKIAVVIRIKGKDYEICEYCWEIIADSNIQWGKPIKLVETKSPLGTPSLTEASESK